MLALRRLGINPDAYDAALRANERRWRITVRVLSNTGKVLDILTTSGSTLSRVMSGTVNFDADAAVTRTAEMTLLDPDHRLMFEDSVQDGALWPNRHIDITYGIMLADETWADVPVFMGRLSSYARAGDEVTIAASGGEADHLAPALLWTKVHIPKRTLVATAIKRILSVHGETRFALGDGGGRRTVGRIDLTPQDEPWLVVKRLANMANRHLYYDGMGYVRLRTHPGDDPVWTFDADLVTDGPGISFDLSELRNVVRVKGKRPEGPGNKIAPTFTAMPHIADPLHATKLGVRLVEFIQDDHVTSTAEARELATRVLNQHLKEAVTADFSVAPIPHLEELDPLRLNMNGVDLRFPAKRWSLPLDGSVMSMGTVKFVRLKKAKP